MTVNAIRIELQSFDASHSIPTHTSKCHELHGHTYQVFVELEAGLVDQVTSSDYGMVIDFGHVKDIYKEKIFKKVDHSLLMGTILPGWFKFLVEAAAAISLEPIELDGLRKIAFLPIPVTTAEMLAGWIFTTLKAGLEEINPLWGTYLKKVEVWETRTSCGVFLAEDPGVHGDGR